MGMWVGRGRKARRCYGFEEIALVPGRETIDPEDVDVSFQLGGITFPIPFIAASMDGVVDVGFAIQMGRLGGLAVLNLQGIQTRYRDPTPVIKRITESSKEEATNILQEIYSEPIKRDLIYERISQIKKGGVKVAVSCIPANAEEFGPIAEEAGCDIFFVQATVVTVKYHSKEHKMLDLKRFCKKLSIPVVIGNCVTYDVALDLMDTGVCGVLVGVGPGTACTTRGVLGIGVPQVTATADCAAARDFYYKQTGRYIPIITDGGMSVGGEVCKAFASGADAVMIGSAFAKAKEAPGQGYHWGMATSDRYLPRGTRIHTGVTSSLEAILYGPAHLDDGSQNLVGALKTSMGMCGARNIREMQLTELIIAPSVQTEGKVLQKAQHIGMGK